MGAMCERWDFFTKLYWLKITLYLERCSDCISSYFMWILKWIVKVQKGKSLVTRQIVLQGCYNTLQDNFVVHLSKNPSVIILKVNELGLIVKCAINGSVKLWGIYRWYTWANSLVMTIVGYTLINWTNFFIY